MLVGVQPVTAAGIRAKSWHRHNGEAVATLSTVDGIVFELAWFPASQWAAELGRAAVLPADLDVRASDVPAHVEIPFELADAATADAVCDAVRVISSATSLGGVESTIERRAKLPGQQHVAPGLLRLSVGCEDLDDLWEDLAAALPDADGALAVLRSTHQGDRPGHR